MEPREPSPAAAGRTEGQRLLPCGPALPLLGLHPTEVRARVHPRAGPRAFRAALFLRTPLRELPNRPSASEEIDECRCTRRNGTQPCEQPICDYTQPEVTPADVLLSKEAGHTRVCYGGPFI